MYAKFHWPVVAVKRWIRVASLGAIGVKAVKMYNPKEREEETWRRARNETRETKHELASAMCGTSLFKSTNIMACL